MRKLNLAVLLLALFLASLTGCSTAPSTAEAKANLEEQTRAAIDAFKNRGPMLHYYFDHAYGYAVFPDVTTGAFGVGGAYGKGQLYEQGKFVGYCDLTQGSIGAQLGGQSYSEIVFFDNKVAIDEFKRNEMAFDAAASAVGGDSGSGTNADYRKGVAVYTIAQGGLMFQAAIGGQHFAYLPKTDVTYDANSR
jgi:lipid-binding SYLF domain-containing protein